jgi:prolyl oligopeptidase
MDRFIRTSLALALFTALVLSMRATGPAAAQSSDAAQTTVAKGPPVTSDGSDPFLWLEDKDGSRALDWVREQNAKTLPILESDPHYKGLYADALRVAQAKGRIPQPAFLQGAIFNFWQDDQHVRGIWRRTSVASYNSRTPQWTTVLDLDVVAKSEHANWVWEGSNCDWPSERDCLISLSDGGEDAQTIREFDLQTGRFVQSGFALPRGKQQADWETADTLLVSREWNPGDLTTSGYPYIVKRVTRGDPLASAVEIFRGERSDVGTSPFGLHDGTGDSAMFVDRNITFFTTQHYIVTPRGVEQLALPLKSRIDALVAGRIIVRLSQDWSVNGGQFSQGSLVAVDLAAAKTDPGHLKPVLVYAPGARESIDAVVATRSQLLVALYQNVRGRGFVFTPHTDGTWSSKRLDLPDNASVDLGDGDLHGGSAFLNVTSFLTPTTLWAVDTTSGTASQVKSLPAEFDASNDVVEQHEATSNDGTKIPYFIVHPKSMQLNGNNPTVLYAYGGFEISETPGYSGILGKLWLERGGVYVLANIRGGGEFGPAWHDAGLKTHRQRIYDDFYAVAQDLVARKITTPRRLGIQGGSNGGLLMGVEFTQHPEMWNAVDIQVPLLDMLRYEQIQAGASWVGEYGSVSNPDERAFLAKISPYNNLRGGVAYPEPFIWTTTKDDRVGPQHARKFAAKLAAMDVPYLFYEVIEGGHGGGANLDERAHTSALEWTYFSMKLLE